MKKNYLLITLVIFFSISETRGQLNVDLIGSLNPHPNNDYSDIWGYVDAGGTEYAIMGCYTGTSVISLADPSNPVEVSFVPGPFSIWRDIKVHQNYAYVTTEGTGAGQGLQIIDLGGLPGGAALVNTLSNYFTSAHNIYLFDGFAYAVGADGIGGVHILDLSDPVNPVQTAYYTQSGYVHDLYGWNDTLVVCSADTYDLVDVTDKSNPVLISKSPALPGIYAHSGWMTEDKRYFIGCEEFNQRDITVWDLNDRSAWNLVVGSWQMPGNSPVHNLFVKGDYAHISYYGDGYVVLDISDPANPDLVGRYDTYPGISFGYDGAWGCYPYLPSGLVLISDISTGLYVLDFTLDNNVPVELETFSAHVESNTVVLEWSTATELNSQGFEIERSGDSENWSTIGFVQGRGTATERQSYIYVDERPLTGKSYYRLKQIDFGGTFEIFDMVEVEYSGIQNYSLEQNYPNPFNPATTITFSIPDLEAQRAVPMRLVVYDALGNQIETLADDSRPSGTYEITWQPRNLSSGVYFYTLSAGNFMETRKMIFLK